MKLFTIFLVFLIGCNPPRMRRLGDTGDANDGSYIGGENEPIGDTGGGTTTPNPDTSHCNFSSDGSSNYKFTDSTLGKFNLCRSKSDSDLIYIQVQQTFSNSAKLCLIPVAKYNNGYIEMGDARCLSSSSSTKIHEVPMIITRNGFDINGILLLKDTYYAYDYPYSQFSYLKQNMLAPDAFLYCSNALLQYNNHSFCNAFYRNPHHIILLQ